MADRKKIYDVGIVGTGIAGLSAGMYCGRFNLQTLVLGTQPGGIITTTSEVENYPGIKHISGPDMGAVFYEHAQQFGADIKNETVTEIEHCPPPAESKNTAPLFKLKTSNNVYYAKTVVIATGTEHKKMNVPGEAELSAKGVSYCALCDGAFFRKQAVCVVGGGDSAAIEALILATFCDKIYVLVRKDVIRAEPVNYDKMMKNPKIEVRYNTEVAEVLGKEKVSGVKLKSGETLSVAGVFVAIGHVPLSGLAKNLGCELDSHGYIKVDVAAQTNISGVYAAGDVTDKPFKQAIIGAAEAVMASYSAYQYLQKNQVFYDCE